MTNEKKGTMSNLILGAVSKNIQNALVSIDFSKMDKESNVQQAFSEIIDIENKREVIIPALALIGDLGDEEWKIDDVLKVDTPIGVVFIPIEIKYHGKELSSRGFIEDALCDQEKLANIVRQYDDVLMGAEVFITFDQDEASLWENRYHAGSWCNYYRFTLNDGYVAYVAAIQISCMVNQSKPQPSEDSIFASKYNEA